MTTLEPFVPRKCQPPGWDKTIGATDGGVFCEHPDAEGFVYVRVRRLDAHQEPVYLLADHHVHTASSEALRSEPFFMRLCAACAAERQRDLHRMCFLQDATVFWQRQLDDCYRCYQQDLVATVNDLDASLIVSRRPDWVEDLSHDAQTDDHAHR